MSSMGFTKKRNELNFLTRVNFELFTCNTMYSTYLYQDYATLFILSIDFKETLMFR